MSFEKLSQQKVNRMPIEAVAGLLLDQFGIEMNPENDDAKAIRNEFMKQQGAHQAEIKAEKDESEADHAPTGKQKAAKKKLLTDLKPGEYHPDNDERVRVIIGREKGEPEDVKIGVNGFPIRILRGHEVNIPRAALNVLMDAQEPYYERDEKGEYVERVRPRFNIQRLD